MANIIIKSDERRAREEQTLRSYHHNGRAGAEARDAAVCIAARVSEVYSQLKKIEKTNRKEV